MTARLLEPAGDVETLIRTAAFRGRGIHGRVMDLIEASKLGADDWAEVI